MIDAAYISQASVSGTGDRCIFASATLNQVLHGSHICHETVDN
jgi:hypothetical protein